MPPALKLETETDRESNDPSRKPSHELDQEKLPQPDSLPSNASVLSGEREKPLAAKTVEQASQEKNSPDEKTGQAHDAKQHTIEQSKGDLEGPGRSTTETRVT